MNVSMLTAPLPAYGAPALSPRSHSDQTAATATPAAQGPRTIMQPQPPMLVAPKLVIEFDDAADRFVHTLVEPGDNKVVRRFPDETQLAFSRGVNAYIAAVRAR
ncbi:MAG: hypothetical protein DCF16_11560 [Alphaproteobacteria bacterium]|nr:MAG: hypothetical protein DCF16_11560 [Alphaproteobacteria bacterium]